MGSGYSYMLNNNIATQSNVTRLPHCSEVAIRAAVGTITLASIVMFIADFLQAKLEAVGIRIIEHCHVAMPYIAVDAACLTTARATSVARRQTGTTAHTFCYRWPK